MTDFLFQAAKVARDVAIAKAHMEEVVSISDRPKPSAYEHVYSDVIRTSFTGLYKFTIST